MSYFAAISTKEHYGLRLISALAGTYADSIPVSLAWVSKKERISLKYLERLVVPFRKAGWIVSTRGRRGGYVMVKDPRTVTLKDIVSLVDGESCIVECLSNQRHHACSVEKNCISKQAWGKVQKSIDKALAGITLSEIMKQP